MYNKILLTAFIIINFISYAQVGDRPTKEEYYENKRKNMSSASNMNEAEQPYEGNTRLINVTPNIYYLQGDESNMGIFTAEKSITLIDMQKEEEMNRNLKIISRLNKKAYINYLISTSNDLKARKTAENLRNDGTLFISQKIAKKNNSNKKRSGSGYTGTFKPDLAFVNEIDITIDNEKIEIISINNEGNSIVYLPNENVLFTGAVYTHKNYPKLDYKSGITLKSILRDLSKILKVVDENSQIVPGKGSLANMLELRNYQKVMSRVLRQLETMIKNGNSLEEILAMKNITANLESRGFGDGSVTTEMFLTSLYEELTYLLGPIDTRSPEERAMERLKEIQKEKEKKN
tara:strand:- start:273 stop:1313 length:1041 start_codon:yes stop_codon:yes gene_type:complete